MKLMCVLLPALFFFFWNGEKGETGWRCLMLLIQNAKVVWVTGGNYHGYLCISMLYKLFKGNHSTYHGGVEAVLGLNLQDLHARNKHATCLQEITKLEWLARPKTDAVQRRKAPRFIGCFFWTFGSKWGFKRVSIMFSSRVACILRIIDKYTQFYV